MPIDYKLISRKLLGNFFQGILFVVPLTLTLYVIFWLLNTIDRIIPFDNLLPWHIPGLGIVVLVSFLTAFGYWGTGLIGTPLIGYFNRLLPLYTSTILCH